MTGSEIPYGYCHCGCGQKTKPAAKNHTLRGAVKGEPQKYIVGHKKTADAGDRLWAKVLMTESCWTFTGSKSEDGYGRFFFEGKYHGAHRVAWTITKGPISDGQHVLHKCDTPACCNPSHLFLGTHSDNMRDMYNKKRKSTKGPSNGRAKLTESQVLEIFKKHKSHSKLAIEYGVSPASIGHIKTGQTWGYLTDGLRNNRTDD